MPNTFFAMLARMKLIRRWGLMFSVREENLAEHTLDTAFFTHALIALHNARFLPAGRRRWIPAPVSSWPSTTTPRRSSPGTCPPR